MPYRTANVLIAIAWLASPSVAGETTDTFDAKFRRLTLDAIAISRIAARLCPNLAVDEPWEAMALSAYKLRTWAELPREQVKRAMDGFTKDPSAACDYAWIMHGIGSGGEHNPSFRFLRRTIRSPF